MGFQSILWSRRYPAQAALAKALAKSFVNHGVDWRVSDEIMTDMWERSSPHAPPLRGSLPPRGRAFAWGDPAQKLAFTLAGMTCPMRGSVGDILAAPGGADCFKSHLEACIAVATKEGYPPRAAAIERFRAMHSTPGATLTASMLRDLENGGPIEADHIVGFMLARAGVWGVCGDASGGVQAFEGV